MTCATQKNVEAIDQIDNLFLVAPDTEFHDFLNEIDDLVKSYPEILTAIERDLDHCAKEKKKLRLAD
jgi:hypothetical protein